MPSNPNNDSANARVCVLLEALTNLFFMLTLYPKDPSAICTQPNDGVRRRTEGRLFICMVTTHASHLREEDGVYTSHYQRGRGFTPL